MRIQLDAMTNGSESNQKDSFYLKQSKMPQLLGDVNDMAVGNIDGN